MFREMRLKRQQMAPEEAAEVLKKGTSGVLALAGDEGYPYAVPLSYVYDEQEGTIIFTLQKAVIKSMPSAGTEGVLLCGWTGSGGARRVHHLLPECDGIRKNADSGDR